MNIIQIKLDTDAVRQAMTKTSQRDRQTDGHKSQSSERRSARTSRHKDSETELGCIKCSRCFIGVTFFHTV